MLDDLALKLGAEKSRDLLGRLKDKRVEQVLPAEMELALLWVLHGLGDMDVEPEWWGDDSRPDAYTESIVPGLPTVIEILAHSDNAISGEEAMDRVALEISTCANRVSKGVGDHLYFRFCEESGYAEGSYYRRRLAPADYRLSREAERAVSAWLADQRSTAERLRLIEPGLDVEIERTPYKQTRYHNVFSTMPPETHSIEKNPLAEALKRKLRQLKAAPSGAARIIFLADVGSTLLNRLGTGGEFDPTKRRVSGREIIGHFVLTNQKRVDGVVVFTPRRLRRALGSEPIEWTAHSFIVDALSGRFQDGIQRVCARLPRPRFEGYQARSLFQQGSYSPDRRGWYLGMTFSGGMRGDFEVKVPARALLDLLAGRITEQQFRHFLGQRDGRNDFRHWLDRGMTIAGVSMAPRDLDEDDDHLVLSFRDDAAARDLRPTSDEPNLGRD